jgi:hypothetical protein
MDTGGNTKKTGNLNSAFEKADNQPPPPQKKQQQQGNSLIYTTKRK